MFKAQPSGGGDPEVTGTDKLVRCSCLRPSQVVGGGGGGGSPEVIGTNKLVRC